MKRDIDLLFDRQDVCDVLVRYGSAIDDHDWIRFATCFLPDAIAIYGPVLGRQEGYAAIERTCRNALESLDASQHLISNFEIHIEGDTARTRCALHAQHTRAGTDGGDNFTVGGTYIDELARTPDGWRIRQRELRVLWQEGNPRVLG